MHINPHPTQMDSFNKYPQSNGTLIANWQEEQYLREHEGEGRSLTATHFPKTRDKLYDQEIPGGQAKGNNTMYRVQGYQGDPQLGKTENYFYGKGTNKSETYRRVGPKQQLLEEMYLNKVNGEIEDRKRREQVERSKRELTTTHKESFVRHKPQDLQDRVVGRRVMRNQDGVEVPFDSIDEDLKVDFGLYQRRQITSDQQLKKLLPLGQHYSKQQPITFWREKLEDGNFYMSKAGNTGESAFNKNNAFLKSYSQYKHHKD